MFILLGGGVYYCMKMVSKVVYVYNRKGGGYNV